MEAHTFFQALVIAISAVQFLFYYDKFKNGRCNWEVLYMAVAEITVYSVLISAGDQEGVVVSTNDGRQVMWIRYAGWLCTCPVLLIMLTNLTGDGKYGTRKTILLLVVDQ